jgi:hypothetical protein
MATHVPNRSRVRFIADFLRASGGVARSRNVLQAFQMQYGGNIRCLATFVSDCRKLGADIRYNKMTDTLHLVMEPQWSHPRQRCIDSLDAAVHHAEEWLDRSLRGQIETEAVRKLVAAVRARYDIAPFSPPARVAKAPTTQSYRLFD